MLPYFLFFTQNISRPLIILFVHQHFYPAVDRIAGGVVTDHAQIGRLDSEARSAGGGEVDAHLRAGRFNLILHKYFSSVVIIY